LKFLLHEINLTKVEPPVTVNDKFIRKRFSISFQYYVKSDATKTIRHKTINFGDADKKDFIDHGDKNKRALLLT